MVNDTREEAPRDRNLTQLKKERDYIQHEIERQDG
jgi:hypothetical protein